MKLRVPGGQFEGGNTFLKDGSMMANEEPEGREKNSHPRSRFNQRRNGLCGDIHQKKSKGLPDIRWKKGGITYRKLARRIETATEAVHARRNIKAHQGRTSLKSRLTPDPGGPKVKCGEEKKDLVGKKAKITQLEETDVIRNVRKNRLKGKVVKA